MAAFSACFDMPTGKKLDILSLAWMSSGDVLPLQKPWRQLLEAST
jgi:hypothetical protein